MRISRLNQVLLSGSACVALFAAAPVAWCATTSLTTVASPDVTLSVSSVTLVDGAILSGGLNPTGTITFLLAAPGGSTVDTETVSVSGNGAYMTPTGFTLPGMATGTFDWTASYSGDPNNNAVTASLESVSVGSVPEPSTWGMMLLGFAGLCFAGYRKTKAKPVLAA
jgi:PEP-CTERM motif